jgi:Lipocalin-like domain
MLAVALASSPGSTFAQQKSLKEQLVGVTLVSCDATQPYCADTNPNGILILDASERYTVGIAAQGRPKFSTFNRLEARAEEYKAVAIGFMATFGTWSVNEADKTLTFHHEGALVPNFEGADLKYTFSLSGDELKESAGNVWRRAK